MCNNIWILRIIVLSICKLNEITDELMFGFDLFIKTVETLKLKTQMKDNFIAGMIHDIRNPLSSMICSLDYMKENEIITQDEDISNMLEIASHCAEFIISHVNNFLDLAKLEHSKIELCVTPTEITELIRKIVGMHRFKAENKDLYLRLFAADNIPEFVLIDNGRLSQIMVNLISNSIKFT